MADVTEIDALTGIVTVRGFTPQEAAQRAIDEAQALADAQVRELVEGNRATLTDRAVTALQGNRDFLDLAAPSQADALAQVKALTRQNTAVIRLLLGLLDEVE